MLGRQAKLCFTEALSKGNELITKAGNDQLARRYSQLAQIELKNLSFVLIQQAYPSANPFASMKLLYSAGQMHENSLAAKNAKVIEKVWLASKANALKNGLKQSEKTSENIRRLIKNSFLVYLLTELAVLVLFVAIINNRVDKLTKNASLVGRNDFKPLPQRVGGADEIFFLDSSFRKAHASLISASLKRSTILKRLSKEMREPLIEAVNSEELFSQMNDAQLSAKCQKYLINSQRSIEHALGVLDDLLTIESLEIGSLNLEYDSFDCRSMAVNALDTVCGLAKVKNIAVHMNCMPGLVTADERRLARVLINLLANAIKFSDPGSDIDVSIDLHQSELRVAVQDHGPGMSVSDSKLVFEKHYRIETDDSDGKGHGLGLAIAKLIVTSHAGVIGVDATPGEGSKFWFTIPLKQ